MAPAKAAYLYGARAAIGGILLRASATGAALDPAFEEEIERGENMIFPIKSSDLSNELQGKELGDKLRILEERWISSDFKATREELLKE